MNWSSGEIVNKSELWNSGIFQKTASYIIRVNGSHCEALNGASGKLIYGGSTNAGGVSGANGTAVFTAVIAVADSLGGGNIFVCSGNYVANLDFSGKKNIQVYGAGNNNTIIDGYAILGNSRYVGLHDLQLSDMGRTETGITLQADNGQYVVGCVVANVILTGFNRGIDFQTTGNGWINVNLFENVNVNAANIGVSESVHTGTDGPNGNCFIFVWMQCYASTTAGFTSPDGNDNCWYDCRVVDMPGGSNRFTIAAGARYTTVAGGNLARDSFVDNGTESMIVTPEIFKGAIAPNNVSAISQKDSSNTTRDLLKLDSIDNLYLTNAAGHITIGCKHLSSIYLGDLGMGSQNVVVNAPVLASGSNFTVASNPLMFHCERYSTGSSRITWDNKVFFEPQDRDTSNARLHLTDVETAGAAGAATAYLVIDVDGTPYKIPLHAMT